MVQERLLQKLKRRPVFWGADGNLEDEVIREIQRTPYPLMTQQQADALLCADYDPGTFGISERMEQPDFLFDEPQQSFFDWFHCAISGELKQLKRIEHFRLRLEKYGEEALIEDAWGILYFRDEQGRIFAEQIPNQEYSDTFRRIILFLLYEDPNYEINTYTEFNRLGKRLVPAVLEWGQYSLRDRLIQSISSGLIGMDIKDELAATSPLSRSKIIPLGGPETDDEKREHMFQALDVAVRRGIFDVDSWDAFEKKVVHSSKACSLCWFTDDYIPTMFEMKFMEELLCANHQVDISIIPRVQSYSNDASWRDVEDLLSLPVFSKLAEFQHSGRFRVCRSGMAGGTFHGRKLSRECADIVLACDYVVIAGARSYEMGQGIRKPIFFTGIAVCRAYSETVTGICRDDGGIVFLEQFPAAKSFAGFRERAVRRKYCPIHDRWFPVASRTAIDYCAEAKE